VHPAENETLSQYFAILVVEFFPKPSCMHP
jgi:hypothetical protein